MSTGKYEYQSDFAKLHEAKGVAGAVRTVLDARRIAVSPEEESRIRACTDHEILKRWIREAVTIAAASELHE